VSFYNLASFLERCVPVALSIKDEEADRLAREIAAETGESITAAVLNSLRERKRRLAGRGKPGTLARDLMRIGEHFSALPVHDTRSLEEMLYGDDGLPR
jgi:antitoxin VapB